MDRCATYIPGLDNLIGGGLPKNSITLITGMPGTGKTILGMQYIYNCVVNGENGVYITIESSAEALKAQAKSLGMDFDALEQEGKIFVLGVPSDPKKYALFKTIAENVDRIKAKRIVFDNLATFNIHLGKFLSMWSEDAERLSENDVSDAKIDTMSKTGVAYSIIEQLRHIEATSLIITLGSSGPDRISLDGASEFLCDGIIQLLYTPIGIKYSRSLHITKMRQTGHSSFVHEFDITEKGISVKPLTAVYDE